MGIFIACCAVWLSLNFNPIQDFFRQPIIFLESFFNKNTLPTQTKNYKSYTPPSTPTTIPSPTATINPKDLARVPIVSYDENREVSGYVLQDVRAGVLPTLTPPPYNPNNR